MRTLRSLVGIAPLAALVLVMTSCADNEPSGSGSGGQLEGITWIMDRSSVEILEEEAPAKARATIRFDDGEIGGSAFCNLYGGTYEAGGDALRIEPGSMTMMGCEEPLMSMDSAFIGFLGSVISYQVDGASLTLDGSDLRLTFSAEQPEPLVGTTWRVDGLVEGGTVSSTIAGTEPSLLLDPDGTVAGDASCNRFSGTYTLDGDRLSFSGLATTKMACPESGVMEQEAAILLALEATASFEIEGERLSLLEADEELVLTLVAA